MLKFQVYDQGKPAKHRRLRQPYLMGSDHSALRADIQFEQGTIVCQKRETGVAALVSQQPAGECGELTIQTCLLPDREDPYILSLELARHRLMMVYNKFEEWGMYDLSEDHALSKRMDKAKKLFIESLYLQHQDPGQSDKLAQECLSLAIDASEELALAHAELLLGRRRAVGALPKAPLGCGIHLSQTQERLRAALSGNFDFISLPLPWRILAPAEGAYKWDLADQWVEWAVRNRLPIVAGPVVSFEPSVLPDWVYIWEHDYDTVRDLLYEHAEQVINRYKHAVTAWKIVSGLHLSSHFTFSFDQLMELTRMGCMLVKKLHPQGRVLVEIRQPFGEYYATNPRSIPPLLYTDLLVQNAVTFDALSLRLPMGQAMPGQYARDLMQFSTLLDQYGSFGKPLHLNIAVPSEPVTSLMLQAPSPSQPADADCGCWRKPWSPLVQSRWLEAAHYIALSKPFVEAVAWNDLADHAEIDLPLSGLIGEDLQPKPALRRHMVFRKALQSKAVGPTEPSTTAGNVAGPIPGPNLPSGSSSLTLANASSPASASISSPAPTIAPMSIPTLHTPDAKAVNQSDTPPLPVHRPARPASDQSQKSS
ncbi:MAG: endo-1,4-beta-xylanase [Phycisphaerales bacterium]|nr:endo-1,4-beta-xylanase [Phycisphaerales bacterium]